MNDYNVDTDLESASTLIDVTSKLEESLTSTGITNKEAEAIEIALEGILGNKSNSRIFAFEDYTGTVNNKLSANIAIEKLSDKILSIVNKIITWIKNAIKWVVDALFNYSDNYKRIASRASYIVKKANEISSSNKKNDLIIVDSKFVNFFTNNKGTIKPSDLSNLYKQHCSLFGSGFSISYVKNVSSRTESIMENIDKELDEKERIKDIDKIFNDLLSNSLSFMSKDRSIYNGNDKYDVFKYDMLFSDKTLVVSLLSIDDFYLSMNTKLEDHSNLIVKTNKLLTLSPLEINSLALAIEHEMLYGNHKQYSDIISNLKSIESKVSKACDKIINKSSIDSELKSIRFLKDIVSSTINLINISIKTDIVISKKCLDYCELSLKEYV